jgi:hypothetical protein
LRKTLPDLGPSDKIIFTKNEQQGGPGNRNENQEKFTSRTRNLLFYGLEGGKDLVVQKWRHLMDDVSVRVTLQNGMEIDVTKQLKDYGAHAILFLNIKNYSGGTRPWKQRSGYVASAQDALIEVIAMDNVDLALLHLGGTGVFICQARSVELATTRAVPMQVSRVTMGSFRLTLLERPERHS